MLQSAFYVNSIGAMVFVSKKTGETKVMKKTVHVISVLICVVAFAGVTTLAYAVPEGACCNDKADADGKTCCVMGGGAPNAEKIGWRLGCQAYSFNRFTFTEAVEKNASLGLKYIEAYPGQKFSAELPELKMGQHMTPDERAMVKALLKENGVTLVNYGVTGVPPVEAKARELFDFAKDMGIETLCTETKEDELDLVEKLADEYGINIAIHNHPKPSHYWNPETVAAAVKGRGKRIGACADIGHWMRSGVDPVEGLKILEGRIISFHFKDLNEFGVREAHDVPWGEGAYGIEKVFAEIKRQGFQGMFSIEYEHNWENSVPDIAKCVTYFDKIAVELSK